MSKADYVKSQPQTRAHACHWDGCGKQVPPAMFMCKQHWYKLPALLRNKIWAAYKPGQEITFTPSPAYLRVVDEVQAWVRAQAKP